MAIKQQKQPKHTKNKLLRKLVRYYEIEQNRPRGFKLLEKMYQQIPESLRNRNLIFCVSENIFQECESNNFKGCEVKSYKSIKKSTAYVLDKDNMLWQ
jgi:Tfp pilus assembly protein PilN